MSEAPRTKMRFPFDRGDGYEIETMWVTCVGPQRYRVDNIPFYVRGIACDDIVSGDTTSGGDLEFAELVIESGHSTLRVLVDSAASVQRVRDRFWQVGCASEGADTPTLLAIDVPPSTEWTSVLEIIRELGAVVFDYEEGAISSHHSR